MLKSEKRTNRQKHETAMKRDITLC